MGRDDAPGPGTVESTGLGSAVSHRAVLAGGAVPTATAQDQCGLGAADDATGASLAAGPPAGRGGRRRLCRGVAGYSLRQKPCDHGLAVALGRRPVSPTGPPTSQQARPQTDEGEAPTQLAELGRALRYPLGDGG